MGMLIPHVARAWSLQNGKHSTICGVNTQVHVGLPMHWPAANLRPFWRPQVADTLVAQLQAGGVSRQYKAVNHAATSDTDSNSLQEVAGSEWQAGSGRQGRQAGGQAGNGGLPAADGGKGSPAEALFCSEHHI